MSEKTITQQRPFSRLVQPCRHALLAGMLSLITSLASLSPAAAQSGQFIVVVDGSGSMWGRMPGTNASKLVLVREELSKQLRSRLPDTAVGLTSFGARSGGSCSAASALLAPGARQLDTFDELLAKFNPQGRGPVTLGLRTAVNSLSPSSRADLLLVHDSPDNCRQDVCAFAKDLAATKKNVRIHVLSLALKPSQRGAMTCVTNATGGTLIEADNADAAIKGINQVISALQRSQPRQTQQSVPPNTSSKLQPAPPALASRQTTGLRLSASFAETGRRIPTGLTWKITRLGASKSAHLLSFTTPTVDVDLPPARYHVTLSTPTGTLKKDIEVAKGRHSLIEFTFDGGLLDVDLKPGATAVVPITETFVSISAAAKNGHPATAVWNGPVSHAKKLLLASGTYHVTAGNGLTRQTTSIDISSGDTKRASFDARLAKLIVSAKGLRPDQVAAIQITITTDDPISPSGRRTVARSSATKAAFTLPSGPYQITLSAFDTATRRVVVLAPGQTSTQSLELTQMALRVSSHIGQLKATTKANVRYRLWRTGALQRPIATSRALQPVFHLSPGKYRIESRIGLQNSVMIREFDVGTARQGNLELRHRAGQIKFGLPVGQTPLGQNAYWELLDQRGRLVWRSFDSSPVLTLVEGDYSVTVEAKKKRYSARFAVVAGHHQTVALTKN